MKIGLKNDEFDLKIKIFGRIVAEILRLERCKGVTILQISKNAANLNEYLDAKIGVDTAENEPSKV